MTPKALALEEPLRNHPVTFILQLRKPRPPSDLTVLIRTSWLQVTENPSHSGLNQIIVIG